MDHQYQMNYFLPVMRAGLFFSVALVCQGHGQGYRISLDLPKRSFIQELGVPAVIRELRQWRTPLLNIMIVPVEWKKMPCAIGRKSKDVAGDFYGYPLSEAA